MANTDSSPRTVFVASAWPYANGSLHLGHIASFAGADVLARYHRLAGDQVLFVSGSDCYGTPIALEAVARGVSPEEIADTYHEEFSKTFTTLSFSFDLYTKTTTPEHQKAVQDIFLRLHKKGIIYTKTDTALYAPSLERFLPDRFVEGTCPHCQYDSARGDQCDACGALLDPLSLINPRINPKMFQGEVADGVDALEARETEHFYLKLSAFQEELTRWVDATSDTWRVNAAQFSKGFLGQGLHDRAITRDTDWGVPIPFPGYDDKRIYVWFEAVLGYVSAARRCTDLRGDADGWRAWFFSDDAKHYYLHGKDNVPFHSIILPAILLGTGDGYHLPDRIFSSEYLSLEGEQFSTSRGHAVWVPDFLEYFSADLLRYMMLAQGPETADIDFRWAEFGTLVNGELIGTFGNLVNRICTFTQSNFPDGVSGTPASGDSARALLIATERGFSAVGDCIESGQFRRAFREIFSIAEEANRFAHTAEPWKHLDDPERAQADLSVLLTVIDNLAVLIQPFLPETSLSMQQFLGGVRARSDSQSGAQSGSGSSESDPLWRYSPPRERFVVRDVAPLFTKVEGSDIQSQVARLKA